MFSILDVFLLKLLFYIYVYSLNLRAKSGIAISLQIRHEFADFVLKTKDCICNNQETAV